MLLSLLSFIAVNLYGYDKGNSKEKLYAPFSAYFNGRLYIVLWFTSRSSVGRKGNCIVCQIRNCFIWLTSLLVIFFYSKVAGKRVLTDISVPESQ